MKPSYKIIKILDDNTYEKSCLAKDENNDKNYIIKIILLDYYNLNKESEIKEVKILKQLNHPNIIITKEIFVHRKPKEYLNIVTEFAEGDVLKEKIEKQNKVPFKESQILDYFIQICLGLQYFHKKKIIHNKIQSSNIFLTKSGIVKLGIFNLPIHNDYKTIRNKVNLYYILNEELSIKSDIWALGVLLYELMTFKFPFTAESIPLLSNKISKGKYKPPPSIYSSEIIDLLKHLLNVQARERPSVDEILKLPIIKNRIKTFLDEVKYNKDLYTKLENEYKEKEKEKKKEKEKEKEKEKKDFKNEDKNEKKNNIMNEKNKISAFLNKKKFKKKEESENSNNPNPNKINLNEEKPQEINSKENDKYNINLFENGINDVNQMGEEQYNQLRLLNILYKVENDLELDSDIVDIGKEKDNIIINENEIKGLEKESEKKNDDKKLEMKSE